MMGRGILIFLWGRCKMYAANLFRHLVAHSLWHVAFPLGAVIWI